MFLRDPIAGTILDRERCSLGDVSNAHIERRAAC